MILFLLLAAACSGDNAKASAAYSYECSHTFVRVISGAVDEVSSCPHGMSLDVVALRDGSSALVICSCDEYTLQDLEVVVEQHTE